MITSFNPFSLSIVFLSILSFLNLTTPLTGNYLLHFCANSTFSANSLYQTGINSLLSSLSSNATRNLEFYNTTTNQNTSNPVYGLYLCRGDVTSEVCRGCVADATKDLTTRCSREKIAVIWYDECMIRYSNESIFSTAVVSPRMSLSNTQNITNQEQFNKLVNTSMTSLASQASDVPIGVEKFGTNEVNITAFQTLYNLVQCTPDLSSTECNSCLQTAINRLPICCGGKQGGRVLFPSCNVRYELYSFYNTPEAPSRTPGLQPPPPPASIIGQEGESKLSIATIVTIAAPISIAVVLFIVSCCFLTRRGKNNNVAEEADAANDITTVESLQFDFVTIESATNKFSEDNKLGEGGFGQVYKGTFPNRQEIAVKRLSKSSGQGAEQFKNEVVVVAQLQHRNLARLLGFCLEGEEKILIYEFVPNKSLDYFLYDADMNPKISDFGMARIFGVDQTKGNTSRIVGTYGYMSPEYAMHGDFSVKSDVYSFGVLVLEIISGKKNSNFYESEGAEDLLSYAWIHWRDGRPLELLDPILGDSFPRDEVMRCIHMGLLCVQEDPAERPTVETIVLTLNSGSVTLPSPQQPAFFLKTDTYMPRKGLESDQSTRQSIPLSVNEASITELHPR
uniref:Cysteine-rich receptor-like protein kinase 10 n=1 Tax=Quercus lobata TaxID=97700 RepID=A0A7N2N550_QUELO